MRPLARTVLLSLLAVLFLAGPAAAWRIEGKVYCDDGDKEEEIDDADTPLNGVVVKAVADNGMGTTFTDTTGDAVPVSPAVAGYYRINLPDDPDTYIVMIQSGLPQDAEVVIPVGGSYSVTLTETDQRKTRNFLVAKCDKETSTTSTSPSPTSTSTSSTSTSSTASTSSTSSTSIQTTTTSTTSSSSTSSSSSSSTTVTSTTSTTRVTTPLELCVTTVDHLKCYRTKRNSSFSTTPVSLEDQFEDVTMNVLRPYRLCNPVDKNNEGIVDPTEHQMCYQIRDQVAQARFRRRDVRVENQFGVQTLAVTRPETLCVPASKNGIAVSPPFGDRMKCYRVTQKVGEPHFVPINVTLDDQFEFKNTTVLKPVLLCNPSGVNDGPVTSPTCHQVCYKIVDVAGQPDFAPVPVSVEDEFNEFQVDPFRGECRQVSLLCVPSLKEEL